MRKLLLALGLLNCLHLNASNDSLPEKRFSVLPVPTLGYSPETRFYFGAVSLFTFSLSSDKSDRTSNASLEFNYSLRKQAIFSGDWNLFSPGEKWFSKGAFEFSDYPDLFYGVGEKPADTGTLFNSRREILFVHLLKSLKSKHYLGPIISYQRYSRIDQATKQNFPVLNNGSYFALGLNAIIDTRDNLLNSTQGHLVDVQWRHSWSASNYHKVIVDLRKFYTLSDHIFSLRLYQESGIGQMPFYDLSFMGGDELARGYFRGRHRDDHVSSVQLEYKSPPLWRLRLAVFGGASGVGTRVDESFGDLDLFNYGLGIRFLADKAENINLRLDYAWGNQALNGFYVAFGEAF